MQVDLSDNTKVLKTFSIEFDPNFSLNLSQQNNTQNHGTTVWDSAKLLAFYLFESIKKPKFEVNQGEVVVKNQKRCLELGSGCGLGGLLMASLGFDTVLTDLPEVLDRVLLSNCDTAIQDIQQWWYHLHHTEHASVKPKIEVRSLDWLDLPIIETEFHYILAADCIYEIQLVEPLLKCIRAYSSSKTITFIAMERRDDVVVNGFIEKARLYGFDARMILKKIIQNHQHLVCNEDVEIWKLKLRG